MVGPGDPFVQPRRHAPSWSAALALVLCASLGCGRSSVDDRLEAYRAALEDALALEAPAPRAPVGPLRLPDRRDRRLEVGDQRVGPFDFLATLGCRLSEIVAARNGVLGKVLEPTRRLAHEVAVTVAIEECLPKLSAERAARLRQRLEEKRADLSAHVWNAVWLDEDLERYLSGGPALLFGGADATDGPRQLARAAAALDALDVEALERAFSELGDDSAVGPLLREWAGSVAELERVAMLLATPAEARCDRVGRRLARHFEERYLPLQADLARVDRRGREVTQALSALYLAADRARHGRVEVPAEMQRYAGVLFGDESAPGLLKRSQAAHLAHAGAWERHLEACGLLPGSEATTDAPDARVPSGSREDRRAGRDLADA